METKFCKYCNCDHPLIEEFWYFSKKNNKTRHQCKMQHKKYVDDHKDQIRRYSKSFNKKNYMKKYKNEHKEKLTEYNKKHQKELNEYRSNWNKTNREKINARARENYKNNSCEKKTAIRKKFEAKYADKIRKRRKQRLKNNIQYKISCGLRNRIRMAIKGDSKSGSAVRDLGCSISELKQHLESKFQIGMTWDNWGAYGWHIDHIIPLASFDLTDREQFLKACHYTNLQPLWAEDNLRKGDRLAGV